jgi:hypothetical protein
MLFVNLLFAVAQEVVESLTEVPSVRPKLLDLKGSQVHELTYNVLNIPLFDLAVIKRLHWVAFALVCIDTTTA